MPDRKILRERIKDVMNNYASGYEHYTIIWDKYVTVDNRSISKAVIKNELENMRRRKGGVIASGITIGSGKGSKSILYYARSGS